jgi:lipoprotein-anchoring transpeptidase ErfK/SrfK
MFTSNFYKAMLKSVLSAALLVQAACTPALAQAIDPDCYVSGEFDRAYPVVVVVDQKDHQTYLFQMPGEILVSVLVVPNSTGKPSTPTPNCRTKIVAKQMDPTWVPPKSIDPLQRAVPPYSKTRRNPLGVAFLKLGIDHGMIALHGTNAPKEIGGFVSHGCVRHRNADILKISRMVAVGTPVYIVRDLGCATLESSDFSAAPAQTLVVSQQHPDSGRHS